MKRYNTKLVFNTTKTLKNNIKKRSKKLDISMSDYVRTLIKKDVKENLILNKNIDQNKNMYDLENFNKKLLGFYRGLL